MANPASIRLGTTGKAQVKADFADIGSAGTNSFKAIGDAGDAQAKRWSKSYENAGRDVEAALQRQANASSKLGMLMPGLNPAKLDAAAGVRDTVGKDAEASAQIFAAAYSQMERRAESLVAAIDPVFAAQKRFDAEMSQAKVLFDAGALSADRYEQVQRKITAALNEQHQAASAKRTVAQTNSAATLSGVAGVRTDGFKSAADSASVFEQAAARMEQRVTALRSAIDPAFAAQQRFNHEISEARALIASGDISLDEYSKRHYQLQQELGRTSRGFEDQVKSSGAAKAGYQQLNFQLNDIATQYASGAPAMQIFAQQSGQVFQALGLIASGGAAASKGVHGAAEASDDAGADVDGLGEKASGLAEKMEGVGGRMGKVAAFMTGPWGAATLVAVSLLAPFIGKLFEGNNALDDAVEKLKKDAVEADNASKANALFARSAEGVAAAIREQTEALDAAARGERSAAERANILAKENLKKEMSIRGVTAALLDQAIAQENVDKQRSQGPGQRGELGTLALTESSGRVAGLQTQLQANQKAIDEAKRNLMGTRIDLATESAARQADPMAKIKKDFDDQAIAARNAARVRIKAGQDVDGALTRELGAIEKNRAAAVKAEQEKQKALGETSRQYGREVTSREASAIARAAGLQVNSADRSTARQKQLYDAWVAQGKPKENPVAKPGSSAHERGNALDIQFEAGVTAKKIKDAFAAEGVRLTKVFAETGHWHIEWSKTAAQRAASTDAAKDARDLAAANRELDSDLEEVVKQFDPARAAADEYATSLKKIAALRGAGKISADQAGDYSYALLKEQQAKASAQQAASFKTMFGEVEDPFAAGNASWRAQQDEQINAWTVEHERRQQVQQEGVRTVAGLYRNLMSGGTRSIFDSFKEMGINAIAQLAAKWTLSQIGKLSGSGGFIGSLASLISGKPKVGANAAGTEYWGGGISLVGEDGPELVSMARGARVTPAAATRRMLANNDNRGGPANHFHLEGAVVTQDLLDQMVQIGNGAAVRGAAGGSEMAGRNLSLAQSRALA